MAKSLTRSKAAKDRLGADASRIMSERAHMRWNKINKKDRRAYAMKLVKAKELKNKNG